MGRYKALFIGVNKYLDCNISPLDNVVNDVIEMSTTITSNPSPFEAKDIQVIYNTIATKSIINAAVEEFFLNASYNDILVFYWAGHGALVVDEGYFATYDTNLSNIKDTSIAMNELRNYIESSTAKTIIGVFDCCHCGAIARSALDYTRMLRGLTITGVGKVLVAACTYLQVAHEHESQPHGRFTSYFLEGIKGGAADSNGDIDVNNLFSFVASRMEAHGDQTPVYNGQIQGRIVLKSIGRSPGSPQNISNEASYIINDSGSWCLLNSDIPIKFKRIEEKQGNIIVTIENPPSQIAGLLRSIQQDVFNWNRVKTISFHNYSHKVNSLEISSAYQDEKELIILRLKRDSRDSSLFEMSVGIGGLVTVGCEEIAELRARRILLGEQYDSRFSRTEWSQLEWSVTGQGDLKISAPPEFSFLEKYRELGEDYWRLRRLYYIYLLVNSLAVESVTQLELSLVQGRLVGINFEGSKRQQYSNQPLVPIKLSGRPCE